MPANSHSRGIIARKCWNGNFYLNWCCIKYAGARIYGIYINGDCYDRSRLQSKFKARSGSYTDLSWLWQEQKFQCCCTKFCRYKCVVGGWYGGTFCQLSRTEQFSGTKDCMFLNSLTEAFRTFDESWNIFCELFGSGVTKEFKTASCFMWSSIFHTMASKRCNL